MMWKKPKGMHYTDMCIWIDSVVPRLAENPGVYEKDENLMYNYLWLLVKALAIKKRMFQNFEDYDQYAFHSANRLYFALIKNWNNQGKLVKGKIIKPIKSCLNYTKALLYPMKVEYQNNEFRQVTARTELDSRFDAMAYQEKLFDQVRCESNRAAISSLKLVFNDVEPLLDESISKYFKKLNSSLRTNIKISVLLTTISTLKKKKKLLSYDTTSGIVLWRLPKSMASNIQLVTNDFFSNLKQNIMYCFESERVDEALMKKIISNPEGNYEEDWN